MKILKKVLRIKDSPESGESWLFVGLGNPGKEYEKHRHNIGFMIVDAMTDGIAHFPPYKSKFQGLLTEDKIDGVRYVLLKPQTYMNLSGQSVAAAAKFYKIDPDHIVVYHDELDLEPGKVKVKRGGGNAGHNGLKSIQDHLGTPDFWRVRIGIGRPPNKDDVSNYVLSNFAKADKAWVDGVTEALVDYQNDIPDAGLEVYGQKVGQHIQNYLAKD